MFSISEGQAFQRTESIQYHRSLLHLSLRHHSLLPDCLHGISHHCPRGVETIRSDLSRNSSNQNDRVSLVTDVFLLRKNNSTDVFIGIWLESRSARNDSWNSAGSIVNAISNINRRMRNPWTSRYNAHLTNHRVTFDHFRRKAEAMRLM